MRPVADQKLRILMETSAFVYKTFFSDAVSILLSSSVLLSRNSNIYNHSFTNFICFFQFLFSLEGGQQYCLQQRKPRSLDGWRSKSRQKSIKGVVASTPRSIFVFSTVMMHACIRDRKSGHFENCVILEGWFKMIGQNL